MECLASIKKNNLPIFNLSILGKGVGCREYPLKCAIAPPHLLSGLIKVKDSYNVDAISCLVGAAAIADSEYKNANVEKIKIARSRMAQQLQELDFKIWTSQANFLLVQPSSSFPHNAEFLYQHLKHQGILVRYFPQPRLADKLRITLGTPEENEALVGAIASANTLIQ